MTVAWGSSVYSHRDLIDDLPKINSTFVSLLSSSECVSRGSGGGGTVGELAPSLLTAPCRKELLILAGDVEANPGPFTIYGKNTCGITWDLLDIMNSS